MTLRSLTHIAGMPMGNLHMIVHIYIKQPALFMHCNQFDLTKDRG